MKAYTLLVWGPGRSQVTNAGTHLSPEAARDFARQLGAEDGKWHESAAEGPVASSCWQAGQDEHEPSFYVTETVVRPECTWEAAQAVSRLLRGILKGIMRGGTSR